MKKIILSTVLFSISFGFLSSCSSECDCGDTCKCDQYCVCTKCKHNQRAADGNNISNNSNANDGDAAIYNSDGAPNGNVNQIFGKWYLDGFGSTQTSMIGKSEGEYMEILNDHQLIWGGQLNGHDDPYSFYYENNCIYFKSETGNNYTTYFEVVYITETEMILYQPESGLYRHWIK